MRAHVLKTALSLILLSACASAGGGGGSSGRADIITREELEAQGTQQEDTYTVIQRLHPNWLRARTSSFGAGGPIYPVVFLNGSRYGELDSLRGFRITEVESIQYMSATDATTRFGTGYLGGVILVRTRG